MIPRGQTPERRAYMKAYCESHPKRDRRAYKAAYDVANRDKIAEYRVKNRAQLAAKKKAWYATNRAKVLARVKARSQEKRTEILAYQERYYAANTEKVKANVRAYQAANPEKKAHLANRRRARLVGNGGSHTLDELTEKFARLGNVCFYCKQPRRLTIDHDVPLARGGTDNIDNILPACKPCNSKKNTRTAAEFLNRHDARRDADPRAGAVEAVATRTRNEQAVQSAGQGHPPPCRRLQGGGITGAGRWQTN